MPSGVVVTVERRFWGLSTYIKAPTPFYLNNTLHYSEGLCGNYNDVHDDDFVQGKEVQFGELNRYLQINHLQRYNFKLFLSNSVIVQELICVYASVLCERDSVEAIILFH
jgi:hypothetical protein